MKYKGWILAGFFAGLTVVGTFLRIPFPFVPLTLQVLIVLLAGFMLGPKYGMLSQVLYLILGLAGLPVFSSGGGLGSVFSPSFGYLLSYPATAWIVGRISMKEDGGVLRFALAACAGITMIYLLGASVLYLNLNYLAGKNLGVYQVLKIGVLPFLLPDLLKGGVAALVALKTRPLLGLSGADLRRTSFHGKLTREKP